MVLSNESTTSIPTEDDGSVFIEENGIKKSICEGDWIFPCGEIDTYMVKVSNHTVTTVWIESDMALYSEDFRKALWIVSRQVPHLQFCLAKRINKLWFKRIKNLEIDLEMSTKDALEMHHEMLETKVDLWKGPLWKVLLNLHHTNDQTSYNRSKQSCLSLCVHHAITDATNNMTILRELIFVLNKFNLGKDVQPKMVSLRPTSEHFNLDQSFRERSFVIKKMCKNSLRVARNLIFMSPLKNSVFLPLSLPPSPTISKTEVIFKNFTKVETEVILKLCKANKITVNSFVITAANFAVMSIAQERFRKPIGRRKVPAMQSVDLRRHCSPKYKECSGCLVSYIEDKYEMSLSACNSNFWNVAEEIHLDIKNRITSLNEPIKNLSTLKLNYNIIPINKFLLSKINRRLTMFNYCATNMGNLNKKLPEPRAGQSIEITNLLRSVSYDEYRSSLLVFTFHTFRGKLMISLDYHSKCMTKECAKNFIDTFFQKVKSIIGSEINC